MFPEVLRAVAGRTFPGRPARVHEWARLLITGQVYPALVSRAGASTDGLLLTGLGGRELGRLDRFEGMLYERRPIMANLADGGNREAQAYVLKAEHGEMLHDNIPWDAEVFRRRHLEAFLDGLRAGAA